MTLNATKSPMTAPIEAIKYHAGSLVRQAAQRARVGGTTLSQLRHFIYFVLFVPFVAPL